MRIINWNSILILFLFVTNGHQWSIRTGGKHQKLFNQNQAQKKPCYPAATHGRDHYLIGYGSLMQSASKNKTNPNTGENIPIQLHGFTRHFHCKGTSVSYSTTYLGVTSNPDAPAFSATVFKLNSSLGGGGNNFRNFDDRESFYCRESVPREQIKVLAGSGEFGKNAEFWIYVTRPEYIAKASTSYPIVQSYVDVFIGGCLELEEKHGIQGFAEDCVRSTKGWDGAWVNDRIYPRRPFLYQPMAGKIDKLLYKVVPEAYKNVRIE